MPVFNQPSFSPSVIVKSLLCCVTLIVLSGCTLLTESGNSTVQRFADKVHIKHIDQLNEEGLYGPADGLRSLSYEFCIPGNIKHTREVMDIDPTLVVYQNSPGRIGCISSEYLCIGHTAQRNHRQTLETLAGKKYIHRIEETWFE